jgi:hypothetical protein
MFQIATSSALDGDVGFERAPAGSDPVVLGCQVGAVGVGDRHGRGIESTLQVGITRSGAAGFDLAGGFAVARGDARPRRKVLCGGEFGHVGSGFADDDVGGVPADTGDAADQVAEATKRFDHHLDPVGELFYGRGVLVDQSRRMRDKNA